MKYSTFIFDFDYTLADATSGIVSCFNHAFTKLDLPECDRESIKKTVGLPLDKAFTELTKNKDEVMLNRFKILFREKADEIMSRSTVLYEGTAGILAQLKENGFGTGIVTTKYRYRIVETLNMHGILDLIDIVIGGEDVKDPKPSPEGLLHAIDRLGVQKGNVLYIGDSLVDAEAAFKANIDFAAVVTGTTKADDFLQYSGK